MAIACRAASSARRSFSSDCPSTRRLRRMLETDTAMDASESAMASQKQSIVIASLLIRRPPAS